MTVTEALSAAAQAPRLMEARQPDQEAAAPQESVCVAVNVRPLIDHEIEEGARPTLFITPGEPQVGANGQLFTFDHVFGEGAEAAHSLYGKCVAPLVEGLFKGYNATVFAYGQTGSGKTYTMGSAFTPGGEARGVIPRVLQAVFDRIQAAPGDVDFAVRVGFVEIHKEEIHDLLCAGRGPHPAVHIREVAGGGVCLAGAAEREVRSRQEMVEVLEQGTLLRATAATGMNKHSSRSHAIFTITLEQRKLLPPRADGGGGAVAAAPRQAGEEDDSGEEDEGEEGGGEGEDSYLCAKMHLVDLAGSERAKRTKAVGQRLAEGITINRGLLALGNVINALSEGKAHVPYRDSKLTRMLQDSLGGNSRTVMIACVSPADINREESVNTLRYAARARNIRNKPVINRDPVAAQIAHMRQQLAALRAENQGLKSTLGLGEGAAPDYGGPGDEVLHAALEEAQERNRQLAADNRRLQVEVDNAHEEVREATERMIVAQAQRDRLRQHLHQLDPAAAAAAAAAADAIAGGSGEAGGGGGGDVIRRQLERIAELERDVKRLKQVSRLSGAFVVSSRRLSMAAAPGDASPFRLSPLRSEDGEGEEGGGRGELDELELNDDEFAAQEQAHTMQTARLAGELARLERAMAAKQAAMHSMPDHAALKHKYDERLVELAAQRDELQRERRDLLAKLEALAHASEDERLRLKAQYESRIRQLDEKVKAVRAKERRLAELERMKVKAEGACRKLEGDILAIKQQKVNLQRQMDRGVREFAEFRRQRDHELLQLKKQGRHNAAQLQRLEALHSKQQAVLRRKTEEAEAARKRLKQMEDRQKLACRPATSAGAAAAAAPAAERPFTAPAAAGSGAAAPGRPPMVSGGTAERSTASTSASAPDSECQPNPMAPLLRDERSRREWVEGELDAYCSSFELQKVMEGERAGRKEVQRKLREVEKALAALKNPDWWPGHLVHSPSSASEEKLQQKRLALLQQSEAHSRQFEAAQTKLMEARAAEEARGGVPGDARRWNGVRTVVQARALLKTVFRSASQHKAQAVEAQAQVTELSDEIELLKLRLDIAEQEKYEAAQRAAEAAALLHQHQQAAERSAGGGGGGGGGHHAASTMLPAAQGVAADVSADEGLLEAQEILQQLNVLAIEDPLTGGGAAAGEADRHATSGGSSDEASDSQDEEDEEDEEDSWDDLDDDEEEVESEDEERHALWDPSTATPARGLKARRQAGAAGGSGDGSRRSRRRSSTASGSSSLVGTEEAPVLNHLNEWLRQQGKEPVSKPTVALMKEVLRERVVGGQRWRLGSKKREDLVRDYRAMLGLKPDVDSPEALASAPQQQQQQPQQQQAPTSVRGGGEGATAGLPVRSRILEHTASSLARCNATLQHAAGPQSQAAAAAAPAAVAGPAPSFRSFGSPLPPLRSRPGSSLEQRDGSSTPVGVEGLTPEAPAALEPQPCDTQRLLVSPSPGGAGGGLGEPAGRGGAGGGGEEGRRRDLQLDDLHRQLQELQLGLKPISPFTAAAAAPAPVPVAAAGDLERSPSPPRSSGGSPGAAAAASGSPSKRGGSPFQRVINLAGWMRQRAGSRSPSRELTSPVVPAAPAAAAAAAACPPSAEAGSRPAGGSRPSSPALLAYEQRSSQLQQAAAAARQRIDSELQTAGSSGARPGTPSPLAAAYGGASGAECGEAAKAHAGKQAGGAAAAEATYDLHGPEKLAALAQPLRSSNGHATSAGEAGGGSRAGSPRGDGDFRIGSAPENRSRPPSAGPSPRTQRPGRTGRPRSGGSGGGGGIAPARAHSPRKQAWKPL